jgi:hypothetical protein
MRQINPINQLKSQTTTKPFTSDHLHLAGRPRPRQGEARPYSRKQKQLNREARLAAVKKRVLKTMTKPDAGAGPQTGMERYYAWIDARLPPGYAETAAAIAQAKQDKHDARIGLNQRLTPEVKKARAEAKQEHKRQKQIKREARLAAAEERTISAFHRRQRKQLQNEEHEQAVSERKAARVEKTIANLNAKYGIDNTAEESQKLADEHERKRIADFWAAVGEKV